MYADAKNGRWAYNSRLVTGSGTSGTPSTSPTAADITSGAKGGWVYGEPLDPSTLSSEGCPGGGCSRRGRLGGGSRMTHLEEDEDGYARPLSALGDAALFPQISEFSPGTCFQYASSGGNN